MSTHLERQKEQVAGNIRSLSVKEIAMLLVVEFENRLSQEINKSCLDNRATNKLEFTIRDLNRIIERFK